jgi:uncharacterized protein with NRDE domain
MCLIALAWRVHPRYRLALIANRDELHARPSAAAQRLADAPHVYGGRDEVAGGGWLQVSTRGRLAAVTNVRSAAPAGDRLHSRGELVSDFVRGSATAGSVAVELTHRGQAHGHFNLLLWDGRTLAFASNHPQPRHALVAPGMHAMSNGAFDAPWPKSTHTTRALRNWLQSPPSAAGRPDDSCGLAALFDALADTTPAPDAALPETGVGVTLERALSPAFVRGDRYGTRCSSIVLVADEEIVFAERRFAADASVIGTSVARLPRVDGDG